MKTGYPLGIGTSNRTAKPVKVYIASPYSVGNQAENVNRQIVCAEFLSTYGFAPIIPLINHFWEMVFPHPEPDFWIEYDFCFLEAADCLLRLDGESKGADMEVEFAKANGIPVFYTTSDLLLYFQKVNEPSS